MRIGLPGGAASVDRIISQAQRAEADGFTSLWYAGAGGGDPSVAMAFAGRATERIELGTAVLQTYPTHPMTLASRAASVAAGRPEPRVVVGLPVAVVDAGDEASVTAHVEDLFAAEATDVWAAPFPVGDDRDARSASRARTRELLKELAAA